MKIGILTWFKSLNHGAVLQAYATQKLLENRNIVPIMLDYNRNVNVMEDKTIKFKRKLSYLNINNLLMKLNINKWNCEKQRKFKEFVKNNINVGEKYDVKQEIDAVLIGSDMVFDFYEGYNPYMYGQDVCSDYIFSYAACFGYTTEELFNNYEHKSEIISNLKNMKAISYRDDNTNYILENCCNIKNAKKVIDPVLLYGFSEERKLWTQNKWKNQKYILIYSYQSNMNKYNEVRQIKRFAKENDLKIISVGYYHAWCDLNINADPTEFVELIDNATFVVTDTFHGMIFSLTLNKQFCVMTRNNSFKILDMLKDLNIEIYKNKSIYERLCDLKTNNLDYAEINKDIERLRKQSLMYLENQISEVK